MRARGGMTLVEIIVAMALTMVVFAITLPFVRAQTRALGSTAGRLDADQIARYAQRAIDHELRLVTSDPGQPLLVYAGTMGVSFNANLLARDTLDPAALDVDVTADSAITEGWRLANAATIPLTSTTYPTETYVDADGNASRNETIHYFLHPDPSWGRTDVYTLYRRVNAADSVPLVGSIHVPADSAFFSYFTASGDTLAEVAAGSLPMLWTDGDLANVRAVGLRSSGIYKGKIDTSDVIRTVRWRTVLPNAAVAAVANCGAAPGNPSNVQQNKQTGSAGFHVRVTWNASADDNGGDADVTHYVVSIRPNSNPVTWMPVAVVPARAVATYRYEHYFPLSTGSVKYGVHAVDCGSSPSATVEHNSALSLP
jgi:type II secretory pathway pseudopilin PulG